MKPQGRRRSATTIRHDRRTAVAAEPAIRARRATDRCRRSRSEQLDEEASAAAVTNAMRWGNIGPEVGGGPEAAAELAHMKAVRIASTTAASERRLADAVAEPTG